MGTCSERICKHRILFPSIQHLAWLPQGRPQGKVPDIVPVALVFPYYLLSMLWYVGPKCNFIFLQQFLLRDATHKCGICWHTVSVCLSHSWFAPKRIKISSEFFHPLEAKPFYFFRAGWRYSEGNPPNGDVECKGVWKNDDFLPISHSIWETVIVRWAHSARQFVSIEFSFHPCNI